MKKPARNLIGTLLLLCGLFWTGCPAAAEVHSPSEWLPVVQEEAEAFAPDEKLRAILNGGAIYCNNYYNGDNVMKVPLTTSEKQDVTLFEAFMTGEDGQEILRKILAGDALSEEELPYRYLAEAVITSSEKRGRRKGRGRPSIPLDLARAKKHVEQTKAAGDGLIRKGFEGKPWSREELEAVRLYAVGRDVDGFGNFFMPYTVGAWTEPGHTGFSQNPSFLHQGKPAPDLAVPRADAVWKRPGFSDGNPFEYLHLLTPHSLFEPLLNQVGYEQEGGRLVAKENYELDGMAEKEIVRLSDYKGKKPVLLMLSGPCDTFSWHGRLSNYINHFRQVYGDQIEVVVVATTVHDAHMPSFDYYRPEKEGPVNGLYSHPLSLEERAREAKFYYMTKPEISFPWHLDNTAQHARNAYYDEGGAGTVLLINKDGTIGFSQKKEVYHKQFKKLYSGSGIKGDVLPRTLFMRANALEQALCAALAAGGQVPAGFEPQLTPEVVLFESAEILLTGEVLSADDSGLTMRANLPVDELAGYHLWKTEAGTRRHNPGRGRDLAIGLVEEWVEKDDGTPTLKFSVQPDTRVTLNGINASVQDIEPGDTIGVLFGAANVSGDRAIPTRQIRLSRL